MAKIVNIRNIPESVYRKLKARATEAGMSLPSYVLSEIRKSASVPTPAQIKRRLAKLPPVAPNLSSAEEIRQTREERMRELDLRDEERSDRRN